MRPLGPLLLAWAVAGSISLVVQYQPAALVRGLEVRFRLDRLKSQLGKVVQGLLVLDPETAAPLYWVALRLGLDTDPDVQAKALKFFAWEAVAGGLPPLRIEFSRADIPTWQSALAKNPFAIVLQIYLLGIVPLIAQAPPQARGRQSRKSWYAPVIGFLACLAARVLAAGGPGVEAIQQEARLAGWGGQAGGVGKLQLVHFLVERALRRLKPFQRVPLGEDYRTFATTYLYPYEHRFAREVELALQVPAIRALVH